MREATVHLTMDQLEAFGIGEFVAALRKAGLERVSELQCERSGCLLVIEVAEPVPEERFETIPSLEWWEGVAGGNGTTYLCKLAVPAIEDGLDPRPEAATVEERVDVAGDGIDVTLVGDQAAVADRVDTVGAAGTNPILRTLADYEGPADLLDGLTTRQREVLATAVEMGYFEVPRTATVAEVAAELEVDPSTVSEHLQRAQHNLLTSLFDGAEGAGPP